MSGPEVCTKFRDLDHINKKFCSSEDCCKLPGDEARPNTDGMLSGAITNAQCCSLNKVMELAKTAELLDDVSCQPYLSNLKVVQPQSDKLMSLETKETFNRKGPVYMTYLTAAGGTK
tara:strand:- start:8 stop:358 length:351 start_codon:yes stop_codon:yes gene_type:complete